MCLIISYILALLFNILTTAYLQVENGFILMLEKEIFIDQLKDIVDKAEDMLNEDMEGERDTALSCSPLQVQPFEVLVGEVRKGYIHKYTVCLKIL